MLQQMLQQGDEGKVKNFLMDCDEVYRQHCKTLHNAHKQNGRLIEYDSISCIAYYLYIIVYHGVYKTIC